MQVGKITANAITFQKVSTLLINAGISGLASDGVTEQGGYIKNTDTALNLYVGTGTATPSTNYITVVPTDGLLIAVGTNLNEVWVKAASSTVVVDWGDGAVYSNSAINGVIGDIVATANQIPKADSDGNLVASSASDNGTTFTIDEDAEITGDAAVGGRADITGTLTAQGSFVTEGTSSFGGKLFPTTNDGGALGDGTHTFSDLFLASGAVVDFANGNVVLTQSSGIITLGTGELRITTPGTNAASVVTLSSSQTLTSKGLTSPAITTPTLNGGAALGATSTEIDQLNDVSSYQESLIAAGALSVTKVYSGLSLVGAGAVTLAAPSATMLGQLKTIEMVLDNGDVTLSLANCVGGTAATTCTWTNAGETLVVQAASLKWIIVKQFGVVLS